MHYRTTRHSKIILRTGESFRRMENIGNGFWTTRIAKIGLFYSMLSILFTVKDFVKLDRDEQRQRVRLQLGCTRHQILEPTLSKSLEYVPFIDCCVNLALACAELTQAVNVDIFSFGGHNSVTLIGWDVDDAVVEVEYARLENVSD